MFGGGGGGLNPRKMQKMMEQMGIDLDELDAEEVVIRLEGGDELVFADPDVTRMDARGQQTYQVVGEPETRGAGEAGGGSEAGDESEAGGESEDEGGGIPDEDVDLVAGRTGASEEAAREALEAEDGDLAAAIARLE